MLPYMYYKSGISHTSIKNIYKIEHLISLLFCFVQFFNTYIIVWIHLHWSVLITDNVQNNINVQKYVADVVVFFVLMFATLVCNMPTK